MAKFNKKIKDTSIRIGEVRFSYTAVFQPKKNDDGTPSKYGVCIIIPKEDTETVNLVKEAIDAAKQRGKLEKWGGKIPANVKSCLRDGDIDREDDEAFAGCYFLNASSRNKPGVKVLEDGVVSDALDEEDFYSGCYGAVTLDFFPYESSGNKGVGAGLNNVIKTRDGDRLSGGRSADEDFADLGTC
ncbi:MAG: DUF2815 family protein [Clostridiales bacterium]|nr:DUF2815 family protein [Clostridiales bacterium]